MGGFIKIHRKITKWGWYSDTNTFRVFIHLLLTASYEDNEFRGHKIKAGQAVFGRKQLAKDLGLSEQSVRTALEHLKSTGEITIKATNKFSVATIEKWETYQMQNVDVSQQTNHLPNQQSTNNQPTTNHTQEIKKVRNNINRGFTPPSVEEVRSYCRERKNEVDPEEFWHFYNAKNWMIGKDKMKSWKSAVITWEKRKKNEPKSKANIYQPEPPKYKELKPDPEVDAVAMPAEIRNRLRRLY